MSLLKHMERWKDIEGYEGLYQVSNLGRVKSLNYNRTGKEQILKPRKNNRGRFYVSLCKNGKVKHQKIHRLVARAFIPNPNNLPQVNHKDENPENNCVWNLEWCTAEYNLNYGTRTERMKKNMTGPFKSRTILCIETVVVYHSSWEAQRQTGIYQQNIIKCCKGKLKTAGKLHWQYVN